MPLLQTLSLLITTNIVVMGSLSVSYAQNLPAIDPQASRILRTTSDYLKAAKSFSFQAEVTYDDVLDSGQKLQFGGSEKVFVQRPNRIRADFASYQKQAQLYYDGKRLALLDLNRNVYATAPASPTIDATVDYLVRQYGVSLPLSVLMRSDPYTTATRRVKNGFYIGLTNINGVACHHLAFTQENVDWQVWIRDGKQPVPCKILITEKNLPGSPQYAAILSKWDFATRLPDNLFVLKIPQNARQIRLLPPGSKP